MEAPWDGGPLIINLIDTLGWWVFVWYLSFSHDNQQKQLKCPTFGKGKSSSTVFWKGIC